jgi:hypothetical protein
MEGNWTSGKFWRGGQLLELVLMRSTHLSGITNFEETGTAIEDCDNMLVMGMCCSARGEVPMGGSAMVDVYERLCQRTIA